MVEKLIFQKLSYSDVFFLFLLYTVLWDAGVSYTACICVCLENIL